MAEGFCIKLTVLPSGGYAVGGPLPYEEGEETGEPVETIGEALKRVLELVKENPTGGDATKELEAGYAAR